MIAGKIFSSNIAVLFGMLLFMQLAFSRFLPIPELGNYLAFIVVAVASGILLVRTLSHGVRLRSIIIACLMLIMANLIALIHGAYDVIFIQILSLILLTLAYLLISNQSDHDYLPSKFWTIAGFILAFLMICEIYGRIQLFDEIKILGKFVAGYEGAIHRLSGNTYNPNRWAASMSLLFFTVVGLIYQSKRRELVPFAFVLGIYLVGSLSKTFVVTLLVFLMVLVLAFGTTSRKFRAFFYGGFGASLILTLIMLLQGWTESDFWETIIQASLDDLLNPLSSDTFTSRIITYEKALNHFNANIVSGPGINVYEASPHNNLLAYVGYWGLLGFTLFLLIFVLPLLLLAISLRSPALRLLTLIILVTFTLTSSLSSLASDAVAQVNYALCLCISSLLIKNQDFQMIANAK